MLAPKLRHHPDRLGVEGADELKLRLRAEPEQDPLRGAREGVAPRAVCAQHEVFIVGEGDHPRVDELRLRVL